MRDDEQSPAKAAFRLLGPSGDFTAAGIMRALPRGGAATLAGRVRDFFAGCDGSPGYLVGALPFERDRDDFLYQPETVSTAAAGTPPRAAPWPAYDGGEGGWLLSPKPEAAAYGETVARCLAMIDASNDEAAPLRKVVLSRSLAITARRKVDPHGLFARLGADSSVTTFLASLPAGETGTRPVLVGATPELLVSRNGRQVVSHPLAGSARRDADQALDRQAAEWLARSDKNRREHREVVEAVMDTLAPYCDGLGAPDGTTLRSTATMWHLGTRIVGTLRDMEVGVAELAAALHPTPAVCGMPRLAAARVIRRLEGYDRGFYAGAVGWSDRAGDGEWYVALRCAEVENCRVRLFAGAGIVAGSEPAAETDETSAKFLAMLNALGIDENGLPLREKAA